MSDDRLPSHERLLFLLLEELRAYAHHVEQCENGEGPGLSPGLVYTRVWRGKTEEEDEYLTTDECFVLMKRIMEQIDRRYAPPDTRGSLSKRVDGLRASTDAITEVAARKLAETITEMATVGPWGVPFGTLCETLGFSPEAARLLHLEDVVIKALSLYRAESTKREGLRLLWSAPKTTDSKENLIDESL